MCSRPAVSTITTSASRARAARSRRKRRPPGRPRPWAERIRSDRSAQMSSCSTAAARKVSPAASRTLSSSSRKAVGQFTDGRGLADTVDADDHDDVRSGPSELAFCDFSATRSRISSRNTSRAAAIPCPRGVPRAPASARAVCTPMSAVIRISSRPSSMSSSTLLFSANRSSRSVVSSWRVLARPRRSRLKMPPVSSPGPVLFVDGVWTAADALDAESAGSCCPPDDIASGAGVSSGTGPPSDVPGTSPAASGRAFLRRFVLPEPAQITEALFYSFSAV